MIKLPVQVAMGVLGQEVEANRECLQVEIPRAAPLLWT